MQVPSQPRRSESDTDLFSLSAFQDGSPDVFKTIYDRLCKPLLYFVDKIIDSSPDAEDIVANAFLKLYKARAGMESYEHIKRWMYVIVRNEAIDHLRFSARNREVQQGLGHIGETDEAGVDLEMLRSYLLQQLWEAIERLPRQRKIILCLYFFEKKTTGEIAEQLQINPQTVLNHKTRAIESLRKTCMPPIDI